MDQRLMELTLNLDEMYAFAEKPKGAQIANIRTRLGRSTRTVTPSYLIERIESGCSFTPAAMTGTTGGTWQSQQVICADIDNDTGDKDSDGNKIRIDNPLQPGEALQALAEYGIDPYFCYYSFSNKPDWPKYRVVLILNEPLTDPATATDLTKRLIALFNDRRDRCADTGVADPARIFFGTREGSVFYRSDKLTTLDQLMQLPPPPADPAPEPIPAPELMELEPATRTRPEPGGSMAQLQEVLERDKAQFDLLSYVLSQYGGTLHRSGNNYFVNPCPCCGHNDCLQITGFKWHCHSTNHEGRAGGTIIDFLMDADRIDRGQALDRFKFDIMKYSREEWKQAFMDDLRADPGAVMDWNDTITTDEPGAQFDALDLAAAESPQQEAPTAANEPAPAAPINGTEPRSYIDQILQNLRESAEGQAFLRDLGISMDLATVHYIGYDPNWISASDRKAGRNDGEPAIVIPSNERQHTVIRRTESGDLICDYTGDEPALFGARRAFQSGDNTVFVCSHTLDALAVLSTGAAAIALNSTDNARKLINGLQQNPTQATIVLCLDRDRESKKAEYLLRRELDRLNISNTAADISGEFENPRSAFLTDRAQFDSNIQLIKSHAAARPDSTALYIDTLMAGDIERFKKAQNLRTGFKNLDEKAGGLYAGLYILAAISSLGKTTLALQMADQIAAAGSDVLFFSMEQSRLEMVTKSLARLTAQANLNNAPTSLQIRQGRITPTVIDAANQYKATIGARLSVIECNFNADIGYISNYIKRHIERTGTTPVIFIDYLQILQPAAEGKSHGSKKDDIDLAVMELKRMSRELDLTIIVISSLNRANYQVEFAFESLKESGSIEYTADVVWGLQLRCLDEPVFDKDNKDTQAKRRRIDAAKEEEPRRIKFLCKKNRYGIGSYEVYFDYYCKHDLFVPASEPPASARGGKIQRI